MTDRVVRRRGRVLVGALAATLVASGVAVLPAPATSGAAGPSGVVTITENLTNGAAGDPVLFDPTLSHVPQVQNPWQMAIYGTLLRATPANSYLPELATSATIVDPQTITVTLRRDVTFSDGTAFDATAVRAGILRNEQAPQQGGFQSTLEDIASIDVTGPLTLTIHLSQPVAGAFYPLLAGNETFIASPAEVAKGDLNTHPVGAGPFTLQQYQDQERIVLVRNPRYWDAKDIRIRELDFTNVQSGAQQLSALEAGTANVSAIPFGDVSAIRSNPGFKVGSAAAQTQALWMPVCKVAAPLSDARVRQALNYAIDRNAINRAVLQGLGQAQWALWPKGSVFFPPELDGYYSYNPAKAKKLVTEAGFPHGFTTNVLISAGSPVSSQVSAIIQAEWKRIGVNATLTQTTNVIADLYQRKQAPIGLIPEVRGGLLALTGPFQSGSLGDLCNYDNPTLDALTSQLAMLPPSSPRAITLWRQAQDFVVKNALAVWIAFAPYVYASSTKVSGVQFLTQYALPVPYYWSLTARP